MEGKQTLNVEFRNGSVGNCMLKVPTSRSFSEQKPSSTFQQKHFDDFLNVGFATRPFIEGRFNDSSYISSFFSSIFWCSKVLTVVCAPTNVI